MEQAAAGVRERVQASFDRPTQRTLVAAGQQTLIQIESRPER